MARLSVHAQPLARQPRREVLAFEPLHREVVATRFVDAVRNVLHHVRVTEVGEHARLARKRACRPWRLTFSSRSNSPARAVWGWCTVPATDTAVPT